MKTLTYVIESDIDTLVDGVNALLAEGGELHGTLSQLFHARFAQAVLMPVKQKSSTKPATPKKQTTTKSKPSEESNPN